MINSPPIQPKALIGTRHRQILLVMLGMVCAYMQKLNMGIALVAMAEPSQHYPVIDYSTAQKGILSSVYYYGFIGASIPMSLLMLVNQVGATRLYSIVCGIVGGVLSILSPICAIWFGFEALGALRIVQGITSACVYPCVVVCLGNWVVPQEREKFAWVWLGSAIATIVVNPVGGLLAISPGGWPSIFYFPGILSVIWGVCCLKYLAETPEEHKTVPEVEKEYITYYTSVRSSKKPKLSSVPWLSILSSIPVWSVVITNGATKWVDGIMLNFFPSFLHSVYNISVEANGFLSMLPHLAQVVFTAIFSFIGSKLRNFVSINTSRKLWNSVGCFGPAIVMLICAFFPVNDVAAICLFTLSSGFSGGLHNGVHLNTLDLAPNYSGILFGYLSTLSGIAPAFSTSWIGYVITEEGDLSQWQTVFFWNAIMYIIGNTVFLLFGSTSTQSWNYPTEVSHQQRFDEDGKKLENGQKC